MLLLPAGEDGIDNNGSRDDIVTYEQADRRFYPELASRLPSWPYLAGGAGSLLVLLNVFRGLRSRGRAARSISDR